ncbi:NADH-quinone oxidoreductase subunit M [Ectobacillus ponti]|uniref:NADH-quinone oxidoreductase subunit M n=1 Tax=Ectobacillus ponti TaxID=2961894 RepID=A0AA41X9K1_9BACI|nr:NADH-quinone oxidoreductase subunit M [Ectobacillus ponti]MCP8967891.1 NADH-quinone oxidoreductase subunit M [Ectobacillus ponti]
MSFLLTFFIFSPLLAVLALAFIPKASHGTARLLGTLGALLPFVSAAIMYAMYLGGTGLSEFSQQADWIRFGRFDSGAFTVAYEVGVDGFAFIMMLLTAVLGLLAAVTAYSIQQNTKSFYILLLLLEMGMLGVFAAQNLILFFFFFELTLPAMFFLIGKWGKFESEKAAYSYLVYNGIGSAILLVVFAILFAKTGTTNYEHLYSIMQSADAPFSEAFKTGIVISLLIAFGIKLPVLPLHRWMVNVHVQAPPAVVMLHAGVLLKIGAYGLVRFGLGMFPKQFEKFAFLLALLGVINLLYGAFLALIQTDFRKVLAYSSISHMGIVLIGLGALNMSGVKGAIFQVVSHGLIAALLFFLLGIMENRYGTSELKKLGGLAKQVPLLAGFLLAGAMASLGLPGMSGFVSEFMAFLGLFDKYPAVAAVGTLGIILTAVYLLRSVLGITFGAYELGEQRDVRGWEFIPVTVLLAIIIIIGVSPEVLGHPISSTLELLGLRG